MAIFWVAPCSLVKVQTFQTCLAPPSRDEIFLMIEDASTSEISVNFTRLHGTTVYILTTTGTNLMLNINKSLFVSCSVVMILCHLRDYPYYGIYHNLIAVVFKNCIISEATFWYNQSSVVVFVVGYNTL